jgi:precorrin-3B synthase
MVAAARLGRLTVGQAGLIADLLRPGEVIRLGTAGRIVIPLASADGASDRLDAAGLLVDRDDPLAGVTACSGMACHRSVADVRAAARPLAGHERTHWAGCARQCGLPPDAEAVIAVDADRYLIPGEVRPRLLAGVS